MSVDRLRAMTLDALGQDAVAAVHAVRRAARFMRDVQQQGFEHGFEVMTKADASPATIADLAVQALLTSSLGRQFPDEPIAAEEDATLLRGAGYAGLRARVVALVRTCEPHATADEVLGWIDQGGGTAGARFWTVDPIDGTTGLLRGGQYAIAIARVVDGAVQLGVLGCPRLALRSTPAGPASETVAGSAVEDGVEGGVAFAVRGRGAWWLPLDSTCLTPLSVSATPDVASARIVHSCAPAHEDVGRFADIVGRLGITSRPLAVDSQIKHVLVASGTADLFVRVPPDAGYHEAIWDQAPGAILVQEAGGQVTDLSGRRLDFTAGRRLLRNTGVIASNGRVHDAVLRACHT